MHAYQSFSSSRQSGQMDDVVSVSGAPQIAQMVGSLAGSGRWVAFRRRRMSSMTGLGRFGVAVWRSFVAFLDVDVGGEVFGWRA